MENDESCWQNKNWNIPDEDIRAGRTIDVSRMDQREGKEKLLFFISFMVRNNVAAWHKKRGERL